MAHFHDIIQAEQISVMGHANSMIGDAMAQGYTLQYMGASANRTVNALQSDTATLAGNVAALTWDLIQKGIIDAA